MEADPEADPAVEAYTGCNSLLAYYTDLFETEIAKTDSTDRSADCKTLDTLADYKTCLDSFTTLSTADKTNTDLVAYVNCYSECYTAGSKLLLTLTFVSMILAFVAL